jgi:hypothetical protein
MRAVVLQPMYLPWMGYFGLVDIADVFIFYDDVQFVRQSWQNRNRIKWSDGTVLWLTVPVQRQFGQTIAEVVIDNSSRWRNRHWECIKQAYSKAPFFGQYSPVLESLFSKDWDRLVDLNMNLIMEVSSTLALSRDKFKRSSDYTTSGSGTEKLINLLRLIRADEYVSGPSASSYIDIDKFRKAKIALYWYQPEYPVYPQLWGGFVPYLSAIDLIFNAGSRSMQLIRDAGRNAVHKAV